MDTNELINDLKIRFNHNSAKDYLKNKYESKLIVAEQGGLWKATIEIISFLSTNNQEQIVLMDSFNNPVKVDRILLLNKLTNIYNQVTNEWYTEWSELERQR
jgi:hypothetical protein